MTSYRNERNDIDAIDREILELIARRTQVVEKIGDKKEQDGTRIRDISREQALLTDLTAQAEKLGLSSYHVARIYREILGYSVTQQETDARLPEGVSTLKVAHLGIKGSNTHSAAAKYLGAAKVPVKLEACATLRKVFEAVIRKQADYGVVPVENTTAGSINEVYDLLYRNRLWIVGEEVLPIEHCLLAVREVALSQIAVIVSHPQALAQCADFIAGLGGLRTETAADTASAAKMVAEKNDGTWAAIASEDASAAYNLKVIRRHIGNQRENYTRFLVIGREPAVYCEGLDYKSSVLFSVRHSTGSLEKCLGVLSEHGVNMTKLESRPRPHMPWEYMFYVDIEGSVHEERVKQALDAMRAHTHYLRLLGSYPATGAGAGLYLPPPERTSKKEPEPAVVIEKKPYRLVTREHQRENTVVRVGQVEVGAGFTVIAGPCAVESSAQMLDVARLVRQSGAHVLRGGAYKPRSSPYSFQGLGEEGLRYLRAAGEDAGLPTVSEVMEPSCVPELAEQVDMLQVGARNMQNYPLLTALGEVDRPVLLKRGMMASIDELLMAAEYILSKGNSQVVLCERGIRTFETATRNTLDLSAVVVLKERTHLPVVVDPSHAVGVARWIAPLAKAALAAGADGIMVEVHPCPENALCDAKQALTPEQFSELMRGLRALESVSTRATSAGETHETPQADILWKPVGW